MTNKIHILKGTIVALFLLSFGNLCIGQDLITTSHANLRMKAFKGWEITAEDFPFLDGEGHFISMQSPPEYGSESFGITWVPKQSRFSNEYTISENKKDIQKLFREMGIFSYATFSNIYDTTIRGKAAKTFDITITVEDMVVYKKVIVWEENGYQLSIEKSGDMPKGDFSKYYDELEKSIIIQ